LEILTVKLNSKENSMRTFAVCLLLTLIVSISSAQTPAKLIDGKIFLAITNVNGIDCFTNAEKQAEIDKYNMGSGSFPLTINNYSPSNFEVTLATSGVTYSNRSEFLRVRDRKESLSDKIDDLPPSEAKRLKESLDYLRAENAKSGER